ncbi:transmembrane protein 47-like [Petromyzon marinus]|uniref:Transmembrane protein 47-like n=1 Tax=Petromyzon marinus TaxID=7757 RepID=A0AAJ7UAL0_PETMA|nr:transmembrane protein 47-like [Petromyzon marinus]
MYGGETRTVVRRPYKLIAALCAFGAAALEAVSLGSSAWVTAEKFSLSLWHSCRQHTSAWLCVSALSHDWLVATLALVLTASVLALICTIMGCVSLCRNSSQRLYKLIAALLFFAAVLQVCALVLYPIKFLEAPAQSSTYYEFNWGYGVAWGAVIFMIGAGVLYCINPKTEDHDYPY